MSRRNAIRRSKSSFQSLLLSLSSNKRFSRLLMKGLGGLTVVTTLGLLSMWSCLPHVDPSVWVSDQGERLEPDTTEPDNPPLILWWDPISGPPSDKRISCSHRRTCHVTSDRSRWREQDLMVMSFYGPQLSSHALPVPRREGDLWSLFHDESPKNLDFLFSHQSVMELFNFTSTFRRTSDVPFPTQWLSATADITSSQYVIPVEEKSRLRTDEGLAPVLYVQSDCRTPSDRDHYVSMLQRHVPVDSYGACLNNKQFPRKRKSLSFEEQGDMSAMTSEEFYRFASQYKFAVAIENAVCPDYVTEKYWRPIHLGVVPIVFGAPNIRDFLPSNNSALIVDDFDSVEALAAAIRYYDEHDEEYKKLLSHKHTHTITNPQLLAQIADRSDPEIYKDRNINDYHCFLCEKLHEAVQFRKSGKPIPTSVAEHDHFGCPKPRKFDDVGRYVPDVGKDHWNDPWRWSETVACLMRKLIHENKRVTEEEFQVMVTQTVKDFERQCVLAKKNE